MGQARARGDRDQRIAQAIERRRQEDNERMMGLHRAAVKLQTLSDALKAADPRPVHEVVDMGDGIEVVADAAYGRAWFGVAG